MKFDKKIYENITLDKIDKSQLKNASNNVDMREMSRDPDYPNYSEVPLDKPSDIKTNTDSEISPHYEETERYSFMHTIDEKEFRENKKMKLNQKTDFPSDE